MTSLDKLGQELYELYQPYYKDDNPITGEKWTLTEITTDLFQRASATAGWTSITELQRYEARDIQEAREGEPYCSFSLDVLASLNRLLQNDTPGQLTMPQLEAWTGRATETRLADLSAIRRPSRTPEYVVPPLPRSRLSESSTDSTPVDQSRSAPVEGSEWTEVRSKARQAIKLAAAPKAHSSSPKKKK